MEETRLYRSTRDRVFAGVAGGLGEYFNVDPIIFRIGFIALTLGAGSGVLIYIMLWIFVLNQKKPFNPYFENMEIHLNKNRVTPTQLAMTQWEDFLPLHPEKMADFGWRNAHHHRWSLSDL